MPDLLEIVEDCFFGIQIISLLEREYEDDLDDQLGFQCHLLQTCAINSHI